MAFITFRNLLDPWAELERVHREVDRAFGADPRARRAHGVLPLRVTEDPEGVLMEAELPGVDPEQVSVTAVGDTVTIEGERGVEAPERIVREHRRERWAGRFSRSVTVPGGFDADGIGASYRAGVLRVKLPRRRESRPRTIEIRAD